MTAKIDVEIWPDGPSLFQAAADKFILLARQATNQYNIFRVMLSGGSTPRGMYQMLGQPECASRIDWERVQIFWGDERCVPPDHPDSNHQLVAETLLSRISIPGENIHRIRGEAPPQEAADDYQEQLSEHFQIKPDLAGRPFPRFDLVLLGLGTDGHTASLFPGSEAVTEGRRWATSLPHGQPPEPLVPRVTVTLPVIQAAHQVIFLVAGRDKARILARVFAPPARKPLPAQLARPTRGKLLWMIDQAAAAHLKKR